MNWVKNTIRDVNFPGVSFAIATSYSRWEIDEVSQFGQYLFDPFEKKQSKRSKRSKMI